MTCTLPRPDPLPALPIVILMLKSSCNCRCSMCDIWRDRTHRELSLQDVDRLLGELADGREVEIVLSGGEPLMHTGIESICREIARRGFRLTLLSTGLLLKRHAGWIGECIDRLYISLDGPEAVHNRIRNIPDAFAKISRGIETLRTGRQVPYLGARCTVQRANFRCISQTVDAARELGMDSISFLAADMSPGNFGRSADRQSTELSLSPEEVRELRTVLDDLYEVHSGDFDSGFIVESRERLDRKLHDYFLAHSGTGSLPAVRCNAPWVSAVLEVDGSVRPCFFHRSYDGTFPGMTLMEIVNAKTARDWRHKLDVENDPVCRGCVCTLAKEAIDPG